MDYFKDFNKIISSKGEINQKNARCPVKINEILIFRVVYQVSQVAQLLMEKTASE
jgi:hypothetical protein